MERIHQRIAAELGVAVGQVSATVALLGEGATVPFIARYRKEKTGGLDDTQLRKLEERLGYLRELEDRRATVLKSIEEQGKLTPELARSIAAAETKVELEDLYAPYKPKRRTRAQIAREAGLEPLADLLLKTPTLVPESEAAKFVDTEKGVADIKAALDGARHILIERIGEDAKLVGALREWLWTEGVLTSKVLKGKEKDVLDDNASVGPGGIDIGWICSFSLPIITLCAFILLMIIVILLNIVFWWIPLLKICFPIPLFAKK